MYVYVVLRIDTETVAFKRAHPHLSTSSLVTQLSTVDAVSREAQTTRFIGSHQIDRYRRLVLLIRGGCEYAVM